MKPEGKKRDLEEIREHANDEAEITTIIGVPPAEFNRIKRDVLETFKSLHEECDSAVAAGLFLLEKVFKIEADQNMLARAICFQELLQVGVAVQAKALMDALQDITRRTHKSGICGIALTPPKSIFDVPKLMVLEPCGEERNDDDPEPEEREDADRLSYIR